MFRQMLRPSLRLVSRSSESPSRTQLATRAYHHSHWHTGSSKHHHNPRSSSHKCCRHIPIQTSSALLQIGPSFPSKRRPISYIPSSLHTFHSSRRVEGLPIAFIGLFSALKVRPQLRIELPQRQFNFTCRLLLFFSIPALGTPSFLVFCDT